MELLHYTFYEVELGVGAIVFSNYGVKALFLPQKEKEAMKKEVLAKFPLVKFEEKTLIDLKDALSHYFRGQKITFDPDLDYSPFSPFEKGVFKIVENIPYGEIRTYQWVAENLRKPQASRAVGKALAKNPWPVVIPCHRIVNSDGTLGGFNAGVNWKKKLLKLEKAKGIWKNSNLLL